MNRNLLILIAAGGSAALLLGAFAFQHIGGLAPCKMCIWQRWPHGAAVLVGLALLILRKPLLTLLGGAAAARGALALEGPGEAHLLVA